MDTKLPRIPSDTCYPGHMLLMGIQAMEAFSSAAEALKSTKHGCSALVGSNDVRGAGDAAHTTDRMFHLIQRGELAIDDTPAWAGAEFERLLGHQDGYKDRIPEGLALATHYRETFLEMARAWDWSL